MRPLLLVVVLALAVGCAEKRSQRCERACLREADCAERLDDETYNRGECIEECNDLERKPAGEKLVTAHVECVDGAADCDAVRACP